MDIKINASWFRFLEDLSPEEIKTVVRAIWDYTQGKEVVGIHSAAWETIKATIDFEKKHKEDLAEKRRIAAMARWNNKQMQNTENILPETQPQPEVKVSENKFVALTDDLSIRAELENHESAVSVFLQTGSRYDELSVSEREFVDRADVRAKCKWYKTAVAASPKRVLPPTEEEVLKYARQQDMTAGVGGFACSDETAKEFFDYYSGIGWCLPNSAQTPIKDWRPFLRKWVTNPIRNQPKKPNILTLSARERQDIINKQKTEALLKKLKEQGC